MTAEDWMPLDKYCEVTGERKNTVHARVSMGVWQRGVHISTPDGKASWVNIPAILRWVTAP